MGKSWVELKGGQQKEAEREKFQARIACNAGLRAAGGMGGKRSRERGARGEPQEKLYRH